MLRSRHLELRILRYVRVGMSDRWRATTLPELANAVNSQDWGEVTDALKRLDQRDIIQIRKWIDQEGFALYEGEEPNDGFFHHGSFEVGITANGRAYQEAIEERERSEHVAQGGWETLTRQLAAHQLILPSVSLLDKQLAKLARSVGLVTNHDDQLAKLARSIGLVTDHDDQLAKLAQSVGLVTDHAFGQTADLRDAL